MRNTPPWNEGGAGAGDAASAEDAGSARTGAAPPGAGRSSPVQPAATTASTIAIPTPRRTFIPRWSP